MICCTQIRNFNFLICCTLIILDIFNRIFLAVSEILRTFVPKRLSMAKGLTKSQKIAFQSFTSGANLFLTGKGGTGKSYLVDRIKEWCDSKKLQYVVCAPTGIAAINVGGSTIHKMFRPGVGIIDPRKKMCQNPDARKLLEKADVIIIDEISMVRADLFRFVGNTILDVWRRQPKNKRRQLLVVGDFYQLPPVLDEEKEAEAYKALYGSKLYAFQTEQWIQLKLQPMELQENMRQVDKEYIKALDAIRDGSAKLEDLAVFQSSEPDPTAITICGTNRQAQAINDENLRQLIRNKRKKREYVSQEEGSVTASDYSRIDPRLSLAVGARVIMLNNDPDKRWVNGSFGTVTGLGNDIVNVQIDGGAAVDVERYKWDFEEYTVKEGKKGGEAMLETNVRGSVSQFPMRLGWAVSIHKSQGQTYERVNVDIRNIFSTGQLYVALSRCKSLAGMRIIGEITPEKVMVDDTVRQFMNTAHQTDLTGQMLPFEEDGDSQDGQDSDRYQEGWDDGYKEGYDDGDADAKARYETMKAQDPSIKQLSAYTTREKEKALLSPEERNPKGAGRKPKNPEGKLATKAIRVPESVADILKQMGDIAKEDPDIVIANCRNFLETYNSN